MDLLYTILCFCIKLLLLFSYAIIVNTCKRDIITVEKEDSTCYCFLQKKIEKSYGIKPLLEGASLYLSRGDKVGVVGLNGMGKSTLLKIIAGVEQYDSWEITKIPHLVIHYLPQQPDMQAGNTVLQQVF